MTGRDGNCNGSYDLEGGVLMLNGTPVTIVKDGDGRLWFKAKEIHSFLGGTTITTTMARVHEEDKSRYKERTDRLGTRPQVLG
jgi:prophage antirepressor-like protein